MQMTPARVAGAKPAGFRAPAGRAVLIPASQTAPVDSEVTGASNGAVVADGTSFAAHVAGDVQNNPSAVLTMRSASARLAHNVFMRNGTPECVRRSFIIDDGADLRFTGNVFQNVSRDARSTWSARIRRRGPS